MVRETTPDFEGLRVFARSLGVCVIATNANVNAWLPGDPPILFCRPGMTWEEKGQLCADMVRKTGHAEAG